MNKIYEKTGNQMAENKKDRNTLHSNITLNSSGITLQSHVY
jgi:hypothetical protein